MPRPSRPRWSPARLLLAAVLPAALALAPSRAAGAGGLEIRTAHFLFQPDAGGEGLARTLADTAEGKRHYVLSLLGIEDPRVVEVAIGSDDASLSRLVGGSRPVPDWIAGLAWGGEGRIVLSARGNEVFDAADTFVHELAHVYLDAALEGRPVPRWFHEGFAMLVADEGVQRRLDALLGAAATGSFLPLSDLEARFPPAPPAVHLAYAQSQMFVRWLQRQSGGDGVKRLVAGLRQGMPFALAFDTTFGGAPDDLFATFTGTLDPFGSWLVFLTSAAVLWVVVVALFLWAWRRKRRKAEEKRRLWALQEEWRALALPGSLEGPPPGGGPPLPGTPVPPGRPRAFGPAVPGPEEVQ